MIPLPTERVVIARHNTIDGEIQLQQRPLPDGSLAFEIISNGTFLMASYNQVSERALARHALQSISAEPNSELPVLVGGLGMGFTLQETLANQATSVDVVEMSPYVIAWNRTHFASLNDNVLADPRIKLIQDDLYAIFSLAPPNSYACILLDVDNGPSWLAHENNARLYTPDTLKQWSILLKSGGTFAVWSAQPEPEFLKQMKAVFCWADEVIIEAPDYKNESAEYFIYLGLKAS